MLTVNSTEMIQYKFVNERVIGLAIVKDPQLTV